jgi:hypothetical protein
MTMLSTISSPITKSVLRRNALVLLARVRRFLNDWVAVDIARRERHAALFALRELDDEHKDTGISRCQTDSTREAAGRQRVRRQLYK